MSSPASLNSWAANASVTALPASQSSHEFRIHCSTGLLYDDSAAYAAPGGNQKKLPSDACSIQNPVSESVNAIALPRPTLLKAWFDAYMINTSHYCPVVDVEDVFRPEGASKSLSLAVCMVGNIMRHDPDGPQVAVGFYQQLKLFLATGGEVDAISTLKAICLVSCYSIEPSSPVRLHGPLYWTSAGISLALQIGLHREATYKNRKDASHLRRIFWYLRVRYSISSDKTFLNLTNKGRTVTLFSQRAGAGHASYDATTMTRSLQKQKILTILGSVR